MELGPQTKAKRVLILCKHFSYGHGGTPESVLLAAQRFKGLGLRCDVYTAHGLIEDVGRLDELPSRPAKPGRRSILMSDYHSMWLVGAWLRPALPLAIWARWQGLSVAYSPKGQLCSIEFRALKGLSKLIYFLAVELWVIVLSTRILFASQLEQTETVALARLCRRKSLVLPELPAPIIGGSRDSDAANKTAAGLRLGFLAQMSERKGLSELAQGFLRFCEQRPDADARLFIAGTCLPGFERKFGDLRREIEAHTFGGRVAFLGQVEGLRKTEFYTEMDLIAVPSHFESFGLVPIEALARGCPILVGPQLGVLEFLADSPVIQRLKRIRADDIAAQLHHILHVWPDIVRARDDLAAHSPVLIDAGIIAKQLQEAVTNR